MSSRTGLSSTAATEDQARSAEPRRNRIGIGKIVVLSLGVGLAAAVLLPFIPWPKVDANFATAMVLLGFAVGWALLAALSVRLTDQPQKWAYAPALFMGVSAVLLLFLPDAVLDALDWIWPPALVVLVAWVFIRAKRDLRSRTRTWLLNPVLAVLVLFALGGAYETIGRAMEPRVAMRGDLVDVGAYRLHLECTGTGYPTVILEPGGGASAATLGWIAPDVARHTTVCVYDRAGKGWSDAAQTAPDGAQTATDLQQASRAGRSSRPLRAGRALLRRPVCDALRRAVSRRGRRHGAHQFNGSERHTGVADDRRLGQLPQALLGVDVCNGSARSGPVARPNVRLGSPAAVPGRGTRQRCHRQGDGGLHR